MFFTNFLRRNLLFLNKLVFIVDIYQQIRVSYTCVMEDWLLMTVYWLLKTALWRLLIKKVGESGRKWEKVCIF